MKRLKNEITYSAGITEKGAGVRIKTENKEALKAIHEFLRFQIIDLTVHFRKTFPVYLASESLKA